MLVGHSLAPNKVPRSYTSSFWAEKNPYLHGLPTVHAQDDTNLSARKRPPAKISKQHQAQVVPKALQFACPPDRSDLLSFEPCLRDQVAGAIGPRIRGGVAVL